MGFDRLRAQSQALGDLRVRSARAKKPKDLEFPVAQAAQRMIGRLAATGLFEQARGCFGAERHAAPEHEACRFNQPIRSGILAAVAAGPGPKRPTGIERLIVHRKNKHRQGWPAGSYVLGQFQSVASRQADVSDHEIGLELLHGRQGGLCLLDRTTDFKIGRGSEPQGRTIPHHGMVINEQDALSLGGLGCGGHGMGVGDFTSLSLEGGRLPALSILLSVDRARRRMLKWAGGLRHCRWRRRAAVGPRERMTSIPWKNTVLVLAAALLGLASLLVTVTLSLRLQDRILLVQAVRDLRRQVALLGTALREAEAAQRMFVITGDEAHRALLTGVGDSMAGRWRGLEMAARAVPGLTTDLGPLRSTTEEALASLEETAEIRSRAGQDEAIRRVKAGQSEQQLLAVHMQLEALTEEMEQRTEEETRSLAKAEARGRAASVGAGLVALGLGTLGVWQWWWSLGQYRRQLELAADKTRAEQMARDKGHFLAAMSHEVRTPLNTILGMSGQLLDVLPAGPLEAKAEAVQTAAQTMLRLVNDLLDLSRLEAGRLELVCSAIDANEELNWLRRLLGPQAEVAGVILDSTAAPDVPRSLWLDQGRFRQILVNLVANGIKFTPRGGRVRVRLERSESAQGPELVVEVKDTGIGIAPELQATVFQPYVQGLGRRTAHPEHGTGLGLAIVQQLVTLMRGTISLQSRPGAGATFRVLLPLREPPEPSAVSAVAARSPAPESAHALVPTASGVAVAPWPAEAAHSLRTILGTQYPPAAATQSTADVKRLADSLATLARSTGCAVLAEEASRLEAASASFALNELAAAIDGLPDRLSPLTAE